MGHIIRNRMTAGRSVVEGNNPYTIQGHPVSTRVEGQSSGIRDYMDLTDQILEIPRELSHYRYDSPLMGGSHTVKNHSGPVNDYLATQYLSKKPDQGYMGPENRPAETPDITIGKGGTIDVKLRGTIWSHENLVKLTADDFKTNVIMGVYYNLTDFDDPNAPAYPVTLGNNLYDVTILTPTPANTLESVRPFERIVGYVTLNDLGKTVVNAHIRTFRAKGGNPCEIRASVGWFEIQDYGDSKNVKIIVKGAILKQDKTNDDVYEMTRLPLLPSWAYVPAERIWIWVACVIDGHEYGGMFVPVWDIRSISTTVVNNWHTTNINVWVGEPTAITIRTKADKREVPRDIRATRLLPMYFSTPDDPAPRVIEHPFFSGRVFPPLCLEAFPSTGGRCDVSCGEFVKADYLPDWAPNSTAKVWYAVPGSDEPWVDTVTRGYYHGNHFLTVPSASSEWSTPFKDYVLKVAPFAPMDDLRVTVTPGEERVKDAFIVEEDGTLRIVPYGFTHEHRGVEITTVVDCVYYNDGRREVLDGFVFTLIAPQLLRRNVTLDVSKGSVTASEFIAVYASEGADVAYSAVCDAVTVTIDTETGMLSAAWSETYAGDEYDAVVSVWMRDGKNNPAVVDKCVVTIRFESEEQIEQHVPEDVPTCTRITASVVRKPCRGPEDLLVVAQFSDGSARELSMSEYQIVRSSSGMMTIAYGDEPAIVTDVSLQ